MFAPLVAVALALPQDPPDLRAPAVPLVAHDPYFSLWSPCDRPTDGWPTHWTGREWPVGATIAIDGEVFRLLGKGPDGAPALPWRRTQVTATRTVFAFANDAIALDLAFVTPALPDDLEVLSRPLTYVVWRAANRDGRAHELDLAFDVPALVAIDHQGQPTAPVAIAVPGLDAAGLGSTEQPLLQARGDDRRIDWGYAYLAQPAGTGRVAATAEHVRAEAHIRLAAAADARAEHWLMFAYDDVLAIRYFDRDLVAYWRHREGASAATLLATGLADRERLDAATRAFDRAFAATATALGGPRYAQLCALAYRQALAGNKLCADRNGQPLLFPKENFSNGCIATVDVIYPMAPLFLLFGADLAKAMLVPPLDYASSARWRFPFAPHDLGQYPHATGQVYGGGERDEKNQMPVEESADLLLLIAALVQREGSGAFAERYWPTLGKWAAYLEQKGFDPERQLCTDDFTGHLAHNVNLSGKAILALGAFAKLCLATGHADEAARWRAVAEQSAAKWIAAAQGGADGATRLAFDKPGTWSQKYNLVWDGILGLQLFPREVFARELAAYRQLQNRYGLPLDDRATFTKLDWTLWSACLTGDRADFDALVGPLWQWVHETPDRVAMSDWYETKTGKHVGFVARPVVGGLFLRFLQDDAAWQRWFDAGQHSAKDWAPLPLGTVATLVPTAEKEAIDWQFTMQDPGAGWQAAGFDDTRWQRGPAGFGKEDTPGAVVRTIWDTADVWARRPFTLAADAAGTVHLYMHHDEDAEVWIDGELAVRVRGYTMDYQRFALLPTARAKLTKGEHTLAVHCHQTSGGQYIDLGLVTVELPE